MKPLAFSLHARHVAEQRAIKGPWIEAAARAPDWTMPDPSGAERRFRIIAEHQNRILRVVCVETDTEVRVITVFFDRRARRPS
jgi:hypothetical protein